MKYFKSKTNNDIYRIDNSLSNWEYRWAQRYDVLEKKWVESGMTYKYVRAFTELFKKLSEKEAFVELL